KARSDRENALHHQDEARIAQRAHRGIARTRGPVPAAAILWRRRQRLRHGFTHARAPCRHVKPARRMSCTLRKPTGRRNGSFGSTTKRYVTLGGLAFMKVSASEARMSGDTVLGLAVMTSSARLSSRP